MDKSLRALALVFGCSIAQMAWSAPGNLPYDFSYSMFGSSSIRPLLAFNDGFNTYVQPADFDAIAGVVEHESSKQGPYLVIEGVPSEFVLMGRDGQRMTIRYQQHAASPAVTLAHGGSLAMAAAGQPGSAPVCADDAVETSIIAVTFAEGGDRLSESGERQVLESVGRPGVERIVITSPRNIGRGGVMRRNDYLAGLLGRIGIPRARVSFVEGDTFEGSTEIEVRSRSAQASCEPGRPYATSDGRNLTVTAIEADLNSTFAQIARALQKRFVVEGNIQPTVINLQVSSMPIMQALMAIGDKITTVADVVLRDDELVLRYKQSGTWGRL